MSTRIEPVTVAQGRLAELNLDSLVQAYQPGQLGELQLFLRLDLKDGDRSAVEAAANQLEASLVSQGAKPWPGESRIVFLSWENRALSLRFTNNPFFAALGSALVAGATAVVAIAAIVQVMDDLGVPIPTIISSWADAIIVAATISLFILILRYFGIPLLWLVPAGFLIFALLQPDFAWKAIKWVIRHVTDVVGGIIGNFFKSDAAVPLLLIGAGGLGLYLVTRRR